MIGRYPNISMKGRHMNIDDLKNPELQERLKNAKTPEELLAIVKEAGYELTDEQLNAIAGGSWCHECKTYDTDDVKWPLG